MTTARVLPNSTSVDLLSLPLPSTSRKGSVDTNAIQSRDEAKRHPLGVKPSGNALTSDTNLQSSMGTFTILPDVMILLLFEFLDEQALTLIIQNIYMLFCQFLD